ncbi:hypothetical protein BH09BAC5_BH09BAC5_05080 [soil metagenome]
MRPISKVQARFIFIFLIIFSIQLSAQNRDSLLAAYKTSADTRDNEKKSELAGMLGMYYESQNMEDSSVYYFTICENNTTNTVNKANAIFHIARISLFTDPELTFGISKKAYLMVANTICEPRANLCNLIGIYYSRNGHYDSSIYYYNIGLSTAEKLKNDKLINKIKGNLGDVNSYKGDYAAALVYQLASLSYMEKVSDSAGIIRGIINVGNTYNYMAKDSVALEYYMRIYPILKNQKNRLAANLFNSIAVAYGDLSTQEQEGSVTWKQLTAVQKSFLDQALIVKTALHDSIGLGNTFINLGMLELKLKNNSEAEAYFLRSMNIAEKIHNPRLIIASSQELGELYVSENRLAKALPLFLNMYKLSLADKDLSGEHDALSKLYSTYHKLGDDKNAYGFLYKFKEIEKEMHSEEEAKQVAEAEAKYKNEEKERQNQKLIYENKLIASANEKAEQEKKYILIFSVIGLTASFLIFLLVFRTSRIKAKAKEEQEITKAIFESEQKERIRISRDLHDNVGTQLSLISNDIEWITHPLKQFTEKEKSEKLEMIGSASKEVINTLRETIWALNKEEVSFEEFADKLKAYVQKQIAISKNVKPSFHENLESTILLGPSEALGLFRICQEAIANSLKYANAETLNISMNAKQGKYAISISDSGKGFDQNTIERSGHFGLANMEFRAKEIACELKIESSASDGTTISIRRK